MMHGRETELAHAGLFGIWRAEQGKVLQNAHSINQRVTDALSGHGVIFGNVANDFFQVRDGPGRKDYFAAHETTRWRTSSIGTPLPASTSRMLSSKERTSRCSSSALSSGSVCELSQSERVFFPSS